VALSREGGAIVSRSVRRPLAAVGFVLTVAKVVRADDTEAAAPFELAWEAPAGCPDESFVRRQVEQIVRASPLARTVVSANGKVRAMGGGPFQLVLTLRTGELEEIKTIEAASCSSLAQGTATIIALAIESPAGPSGDERGAVVPPSRSQLERGPAREATVAPEREQGAVVDSGPASTSLPATGTAPSPASPPRRSWSFVPGAFGSIETATLPDAAAGVGVSAALGVDRFGVGLVGTMWVPQSSRFSGTGGAAFSMMSGGASGAYVVPLGSVVGLGPSASVEATSVRVRGFGVRTPLESSTVWPTLSAGGRLEVHAARWLSLVARAQMLLHIDAPAFSLATAEEPLRVHQPSLLAARMSLGAEIVLP
jgi:hypothetical protein